MLQKSSENFNTFIRILTLSHESFFDFVLSNSSKQKLKTLEGVDLSQTNSDLARRKFRQMHARFVYSIFMFVFAIFALSFKISANTMFFYLQDSIDCKIDSLINTCFSMTMVNRLSFTIVFYHIGLFIVNMYRSSETDFINDYCWLIKTVFFSEFFFVMCLIPNSIFNWFSIIAKYVTMVFLFVKILILTDAFHYFCHGTTIFGNEKKTNIRENSRQNWTKNTKIALCVISSIIFLIGLGSFVFIYIWVNKTCSQYLIMTSIVLFMCVVFFFSHLIINCKKISITSGLFIVFIFGASVWGFVFGTPFSECSSTSGVNFKFITIAGHVDAIIRIFKRSYFIVHFAGFSFFCES